MPTADSMAAMAKKNTTSPSRAAAQVADQKAAAAKPAPVKAPVVAAKAPVVGRVPAATTKTTTTKTTTTTGKGAAVTANAVSKNAPGATNVFTDIGKNLGNFANDVGKNVGNFVKDLGTDQQADRFKADPATIKGLSKGTTQQRLDAWAASKPKDVLWGNADFANAAKQYGLTSKDVSGYLTSNKVKNTPQTVKDSSGKTRTLSTAEIQAKAAATDTSPVSKVARIGAYLTPGIGAAVSAGGVLGGSQKLAGAKTDVERNAAISEIGWNALGLAAGAAPKIIQTAKTAKAAKVVSPERQAAAALKSGKTTMKLEDKAVVKAAKGVLKDAKKYTVTGEATKVLKDATTTKSVTSADKIIKGTKQDTGKVFDKYAVGSPTQQAEKILKNDQANVWKGYDIAKEGKGTVKGTTKGTGPEELGGGGVSRTGGGVPGRPGSGGVGVGSKYVQKPSFTSGGNVAGGQATPRAIQGGTATTSKGNYGSAVREQTLNRNLVNNSWNTKSVAPQALRKVDGETTGTVITKVADDATTIRGGQPPVVNKVGAPARSPKSTPGKPGDLDGPPMPIIPKPSVASRLGKSPIVSNLPKLANPLATKPGIGTQFKAVDWQTPATGGSPELVNKPRGEDDPQRIPAPGPSSRPTPNPKPGPGPGNGGSNGTPTDTNVVTPKPTPPGNPVRPVPRIVAASQASAGLGAIQSNWADYRQNYNTRVNTAAPIDPLHEKEAVAQAAEAGTDYKPRSRSASFHQGAVTYRTIP